MTRWRGFTDALQEPLDLLAKMEHDFARLQAQPDDPFAAFDFFVAAEHMPDWRYPSDPLARSAIRKRDPGRTVSHLASGAKHFEATDPRHGSVAGVEREPDYGTSVLGRARLGEMRLGSMGRPALIVTMVDGRRVDALELATLILAYWRTELAPGGIHEVAP
jgi:hypothetical protein